MPIRLVRRHASARGADQEALLDQVRLDHVLKRAALLAQRRGQRFDADRAAVEVLDDQVEQAPVQVVETFRIHLQHLHRGIRDVVVDARSEEHTSELQSLMRISYAVFCLKKKNKKKHTQQLTNQITISPHRRLSSQ